MTREALSVGWMASEQDGRISQIVERERGRLRRFIRRHLTDGADVDDVLQDVFFELTEADRLMKPIEEVGAWLFQVARNRIADLFRKRKVVAFPETTALRAADDQPVERLSFEDLLPSSEAGPDVAYARRLLLDELDAALDELPDEQREVFVAHEIEGMSFRDLAAETGESVNTLLSRKHYAVLRLRRRLRDIHEEFEEIWKAER
jgi:RNA polymerase sigma factor (sigma-70 family)